jgi:hypothetical protein
VGFVKHHQNGKLELVYFHCQNFVQSALLALASGNY